MTDVWVCFDASGNCIANTKEEQFSNLLEALPPSVFDVSSCLVIKNPEGYYDGCDCSLNVSSGNVIVTEISK